jgi:hypothetical protein
MSTIDRPQSEGTLDDVGGAEPPEGPAAAALIAAGTGCLAVGIFTTAAEASSSFASSITYNTDVGALSGKTTLAVVVWLVVWAILHVVLRHRPFPITRALTVCLVLTAAGFLLTFPTFFELFA